jgi:hypothetical protein
MKIGTWWSDTWGGSEATFTTFRCIVVVPSAMLIEINFTVFHMIKMEVGII